MTIKKVISKKKTREKMKKSGSGSWIDCYLMFRSYQFLIRKFHVLQCVNLQTAINT